MTKNKSTGSQTPFHASTHEITCVGFGFKSGCCQAAMEDCKKWRCFLLGSSWCRQRCCSACLWWRCFLVCFLQVFKFNSSVTYECLGPYPADVLEKREPSDCADPTDVHPKPSQALRKPVGCSILWGAQGKVKPIIPIQFWFPLSRTRKANTTNAENQTAVVNKFPLWL